MSCDSAARCCASRRAHTSLRSGRSARSLQLPTSSGSPRSTLSRRRRRAALAYVLRAVAVRPCLPATRWCRRRGTIARSGMRRCSAAGSLAILTRRFDAQEGGATAVFEAEFAPGASRAARVERIAVRTRTCRPTPRTPRGWRCITSAFDLVGAVQAQPLGGVFTISADRSVLVLAGEKDSRIRSSAAGVNLPVPVACKSPRG